MNMSSIASVSWDSLVEMTDDKQQQQRYRYMHNYKLYLTLYHISIFPPKDVLEKFIWI